MSFSFSFICTPDSLSTEGAKATETVEQSLSSYEGRAESVALVDEALSAVHGLILSGDLGTGEFSVTVNGHAEPGHEDRDGWSPDTITVHVSRLRHGSHQTH